MHTIFVCGRSVRLRLAALAASLLASCLAGAVLIFAQATYGGGGADVLMQHNDPARTGANPKEIILKPANVNKDQFGKLFDIPVDGFVYSQPLVVSGLAVKGEPKNVLYVATEHNTLYALDADTGAELWKRNYGPTMATPSVYFVNVGGNSPYHDLNPEIGITSTPVIDRATETIYFTSFTQSVDTTDQLPVVTFHHHLHAVDLATGNEKFGAPIEIRGCVTSEIAVQINTGHLHRGRHSVNTQLCFNPLQEMQRPGVLVVKRPGNPSQVVLAFASHGDYQPYYGWLISYQADDVKKQLGIWVSNTDNSEDSNGAGVWQAGMGPALDNSGNFYVMLGNGFNDSQHAFAESFLRFSTDNSTIAYKDSFTPCNQGQLDSADDDVGSSGPLLLIDERMKPLPHYVAGGGKQGRIYLLNKDHLGGMQACKVANCGPPNPQQFCDPQVHQEFQAVRSPSGETHHIHGAPVFWISPQRGPVIYVWGENDHLRAYPLTASGAEWSFNTFPTGNPNGDPPTWAVSQAQSPAQPWNPGASYMTGGMLSISADGDHDAILWAATPTNNDANVKAVPGILRAYDANDLSKELWDSYQDVNADDFGNYSKFTPVTVANGKVYVPTFSGHVSVYGLREAGSAAARTNLIQNGGFESGTTGWTGTTGRFGSQPNFPYYGKANGVLCTTQTIVPGNTSDVCPTTLPATPVDAQLSQTVTAPATGRYTLRARCATNILPNNHWIGSGEVQLGVNLDGHSVAAKVITAWVGYQVYVIDFDVRQGQQIQVWYKAPGVKTDQSDPQIHKQITTDAWATIDEVELLGPGR